MMFTPSWWFAIPFFFAIIFMYGLSSLQDHVGGEWWEAIQHVQLVVQGPLLFFLGTGEGLPPKIIQTCTSWVWTQAWWLGDPPFLRHPYIYLYIYNIICIYIYIEFIIYTYIYIYSRIYNTYIYIHTLYIHIKYIHIYHHNIYIYIIYHICIYHI